MKAIIENFCKQMTNAKKDDPVRPAENKKEKPGSVLLQKDQKLLSSLKIKVDNLTIS